MADSPQDTAPAQTLVAAGTVASPDTKSVDAANAKRVRKNVETQGDNKAVDVFDGGVNLGYQVYLAPKGDETDDVNGLASRIKGWTTFFVDGQEFEYSEANARELVGRFPFVAESLRRADEEDTK